MNPTAAQGRWVIGLSLLVGLVLAIFPLPEMLRYIRPDITALIIAYWVLALPQSMGMFVAWITGLCLDVLVGTPLGLNGLCFTLVAFVFGKLHRQIRLTPVWQQTLLIFLSLLILQAIRLWVGKLAGTAMPSWAYWLPALSSAALWPPTFLLLRYFRRHFEVK